MHLAVLAASLDITIYLVGRGADIASKNKHGDTPLHLAVLKNSLDTTKYSLDIMKYLIEQQPGIITTPNKNGESPLSLEMKNYGVTPDLIPKKSLSWVVTGNPIIDHIESINAEDRRENIKNEQKELDALNQSIEEELRRLEADPDNKPTEEELLKIDKALEELETLTQAITTAAKKQFSEVELQKSEVELQEDSINSWISTITDNT